MKKTLLITIFLLYAALAFCAIDPYFGLDYQMPSATEYLSKNHSDYDSIKSRNPMDDITNKLDISQKSPSSSQYSYLVRTGAYLSERNRVGIEVSRIGKKAEGHVPVVGNEFDYTQKIVYSNLAGTFAQELWTGFFVDVKAGWGWRWYEMKKDYVDAHADSSRGEYTSGPLVGVGLGWNQKLWWKFSLAASINWDHHIYVSGDVTRASLFTGNVGLNWGLHYHSFKTGKN